MLANGTLAWYIVPRHEQVNGKSPSGYRCNKETQLLTDYQKPVDKEIKDASSGSSKENCLNDKIRDVRSRNLPPKVLKNTLALLNQMIKYFQNLGIIDRTCNFQVRRLSDKTNFTLDKIILEAQL